MNAKVIAIHQNLRHEGGAKIVSLANHHAP